MNVRQIQIENAEINRENGWFDRPRTFGEDIALIHGEVSEALEAYRESGDEQWSLEIGEELADVILRVLDCAHRRDYDMQALLEAKLRKNRKRSYRHGGKKL